MILTSPLLSSPQFLMALLRWMSFALALALPVLCSADDSADQVSMYQKMAEDRYPSLGQQGSNFNTLFVKHLLETAQTDTHYFVQPWWPLTLADQCYQELPLEQKVQDTLAVAQKKYPDLVIPSSHFRKAYDALVSLFREKSPEILKDPNWPVVVAGLAADKVKADVEIAQEQAVLDQTKAQSARMEGDDRAAQAQEDQSKADPAQIQEASPPSSYVAHSVTPNAYGYGVNADEYGRPHAYHLKDGTILPPMYEKNVRRDFYGPGVHADQFGRPVYDRPP